MEQLKTKENITRKDKLDLLKRPKDYYFLDYMMVGTKECRWIRMNGLTWNQVIRVLSCKNSDNVRERIDLMKNMKDMTTEELKNYEYIDFNSVRIQSYNELDVMVDKDGNPEQKYPEDKDYKFVPVCKKVEYLFDGRYRFYGREEDEKFFEEMYADSWKDAPLCDYDITRKDILEEFDIEEEDEE